MTKLHVSCAAEGEYVIHGAAMLRSLLTCHPPGSVVVHYLHGPELAGQTLVKLRDMVVRSGGEVSFWEIPDRWVAGLPTEGFTRTATWYRTFLPELVEAPRVIYLDADVLVLESLAPLWEVGMASKLVAAVTNVLEPQSVERPTALGIPDSQDYFNAGVMVLNLDLMRRGESSRAVLEYARANADQLAWRDQDAFNVVLGASRVPLHPRWNCMNAILVFPWSVDVLGPDAVAEAIENPAIRHFEGPGPYKPWHYLCNREWRDLYRRHRQATPWPQVRLQGRNPRNMWRRLHGRIKGTGVGFIDAPSLSDR